MRCNYYSKDFDSEKSFDNEFTVFIWRTKTMNKNQKTIILQKSLYKFFSTELALYHYIIGEPI